MVFLGRNVEIHATPELARMEIGRWCTSATATRSGPTREPADRRQGRLRVQQRGELLSRLGDRVVDAGCRLVLHLRFRPQDGQPELPIKDQGIVKGPVRIGPGHGVAAKVSVLRNTIVGRGCVLGSARCGQGRDPDYSIAVGAPARVVKNRKDEWERNAAARAEHERAPPISSGRRSSGVVAAARSA